jgi:hypothetical protein
MNAETLIQVVEIIDSRLQVIEESFTYDPDREESIDMAQQIGKEKALEELKDYLQKYIDNQVAHMETEQGM